MLLRKVKPISLHTQFAWSVYWLINTILIKSSQSTRKSNIYLQSVTLKSSTNLNTDNVFFFLFMSLNSKQSASGLVIHISRLHEFMWAASSCVCPCTAELCSTPESGKGHTHTHAMMGPWYDKVKCWLWALGSHLPSALWWVCEQLECQDSWCGLYPRDCTDKGAELHRTLDILKQCLPTVLLTGGNCFSRKRRFTSSVLQLVLKTCWTRYADQSVLA